MFDPVTNLTSLLGMAFDIVGTTITALFLPFLTIVVGPALRILQFFTQGG